MKALHEVGSIIKKEFKLEWRQKTALYSLLLYVDGTVFICYLSFALKTNQLQPITWNALFWIVMFFVSINSIGKSFTGESRNRYLYYYYVMRPTSIIIGKIIYNVVLLCLLATLCIGFFQLILHLPIHDFPAFVLTVFLGAVGFSCTLTMVAGIASKARQAATLMTVLSLPIVVPMLLILVRLSLRCIDGLDRVTMEEDFATLALINVIVVAASYVLFPYLWRSE